MVESWIHLMNEGWISVLPALLDSQDEMISDGNFPTPKFPRTDPPGKTFILSSTEPMRKVSVNGLVIPCFDFERKKNFPKSGYTQPYDFPGTSRRLLSD